MTGRIVLALAFATVLACAESALAQRAEPEGFPFSLWFDHREVTQIPWTFSVTQPALRSDFRYEVRISAFIRSNHLPQSDSDERPRLVLHIRVLENGHAIGPVHTVLPEPQPDQLYGRNRFVFLRGDAFVVPAIVMPGKYKLEVALFDRATGRFNTRYADVVIKDRSDRLIERASSASRKFEFAEMPKVEDRDGLEAFAGPRIQTLGRGARIPQLGALDGAMSVAAPPRFVVDTPAVLKLSIITVLSPPEKALQSDGARIRFQGTLLNLLSPFTRFDIARGSGDFTGIDLGDRTRPFDRVPLKDVQLDVLRQAIMKDRGTISLDDLANRADSGQFLRGVIAERLQAAQADTSGAVHVIIIVGARSTLPGGAALAPIRVGGACHCKVFYIRFTTVANERDDTMKFLADYKPRVLEPVDWQDFRDKFEIIYEQLMQ
jgi:hypothetical protein